MLKIRHHHVGTRYLPFKEYIDYIKKLVPATKATSIALEILAFKTTEGS